MNKTAYRWIAAAILLGAMPSYGQQNGGTNPDSKMLGTPAAVNTGSMSGLYSPNLYDGSANIHIPIYDFRTDAGQFGVSLGYNTRGVRVDELASPVGLHWNLIAEGSIQRVVKGLPDELSAVYPDTLWMNGNIKYTRFKGRLGGSFDNATEMADPLVFRDPESDDFIVSAGGLSFTFNIGTGRQIYTNPNRNFQVELLSSGQPYSTVVQQTGTIPDPLTLEFLITDLGGNRYHFVRGDYDNISIFAEMDAFVSSGLITNHNQVSRWVVDEVTLADGRKIRYNYYDKNGSATIYQSYAAPASGPGAPGAGVTDKGEHLAMIRSIEYPNAVTAHFVYDTTKGRCDYGKQDHPQTNGMALREVRIQSGEQCTRYQMDQSYTVVLIGNNTSTSEIPYGSDCVIINNVPSNRSHRLRLKGISMVSCDGTVTEPLYTLPMTR